MMTITSMPRISCLLTLLSILLVSTNVGAAVDPGYHQGRSTVAEPAGVSGKQVPVLLAEAEAESDTGKVDPGQADILESIKEADQKENPKKKCMMVCEKWGEDCVINPSTGTRKCRRTCKQLTQECF
jgi:hypothetical protein